MKSVKNIRNFFVLLSVIIIPSWRLSAQTEEMAPGIPPAVPVNGYVILSNGDTIHGKLRWTLKYVENNPVEIKFFAENGETKNFNASEIKGFGNQQKIWMDNNPVPISLEMEHYVSLPSYKKSVPVFLNRLLNGRITVYQNRSSIILSSSTIVENTRIDGVAFSFSKDGLSIGPSYRTDYRIVKRRTRLTSYFISKDGAAPVKVDKDNYETLFKTMFGDCPGIDLETNKNPDLLKFKNFMLLTEVYNQICGRQ